MSGPASPEELAGRLEARIRNLAGLAPSTAGWPRVLFIDGRSGSGKTSLAEALAAARVAGGAERPRIVGMDEIYPGWDGLAVGSAMVPELLRTGRYRRYDWYQESFTPEVTLEPGESLIVEGCGSVSGEALAVARALGSVYTLWIECPDELRRERALARDGETFIPHWERWAEQEVTHFARTRPLARANEVVHVGL